MRFSGQVITNGMNCIKLNNKVRKRSHFWSCDKEDLKFQDNRQNSKEFDKEILKFHGELKDLKLVVIRKYNSI